jgi:hypothetical protein
LLAVARQVTVLCIIPELLLLWKMLPLLLSEVRAAKSFRCFVCKILLYECDVEGNWTTFADVMFARKK